MSLFLKVSKREENRSPSSVDAEEGPSSGTTASLTPVTAGKEGFKSSMRRLLPRTRTPNRRVSPAASHSTLLVDTSLEGPQSSDFSTTMVSKKTEKRVKPEKIDSETKLATLELGIQAIGLCQTVLSVTKAVIPNPLGDILGKVTAALEIMKKIVENRQAWRELLITIEEHQDVFNNQLKRMEIENLVPDPDSPLLGPTKSYAEALEELVAKVMEESGLAIEGTPKAPRWGRMKSFTSRLLFADEEKETIEEYHAKLTNAMEQFKLTLELFTSFAVNHILGGVDTIGAELRLVGESVTEIRDKIIRSEEPKDTINVAHIGPLGTQHKRCLEDTRVDILEEIRSWARNEQNAFPVYCIGDVAGTGKSTIARTLVEGWQTSNTLAFFFSQEGSSTKTAGDFCFFIKEQIKFHADSSLDEYWKGLPSDAVLQSETVEQQWLKLIQAPMRKIPTTQIFILVVDALDECTISTRGPLLECILRDCFTLSHLRVLITTRKEEDIRAILNRPAYNSLIRHKSLLNSENSAGDVGFYVHHRLDRAEIFTSTSQERLQLISRCGGLFIFASLACTLLEDACSEGEPLEDILHGFTSLDSLYHQALIRADKMPEYTRQPLKNILAIIVAAEVPLSVVAISELLSMPLKSTLILIERLGSILSVGEVDEPVSILHATFAEFLLRQQWITLNGGKVTNEYAIGKSQSNRLLSQSCLSVLQRELEGNICDPKRDVRIEYARTSRQDMWQRIPAALRYAASTWISHTIPELHNQAILNAARCLFREKLLNWIEVGGIGEKLPGYMQGIRRLQLAMDRVQKILPELIYDEDIKWCSDTLEFLRIHHVFLHGSPVLVYSSALLTVPHQNLVFQSYIPRYQNTLPKITLWDSTPRSTSVVLLGHTNVVSHVVYSADGSFIISAAWGGQLAVWDVETAARLTTTKLTGQPKECCGLGILPGNKVIVSVWEDGRLYRLGREALNVLGPPEELELAGPKTCFAGSKDWKKAVYGTEDGQILLYSLEARSTVGKSVKAHRRAINSVSFSPDGRKVSSTSEDETYKLWSVTPEGLSSQVDQDPSVPIRYGTFSTIDGDRFAFVDGYDMAFYDCSTDHTEWTAEVLGAKALVYSHDGQQMAIFEDNSTLISLWDLSTNPPSMTRYVKTGHSSSVVCLAYSPDDGYLVTGSWDGTLRIHNLSETSNRKYSVIHRSRISSVALSPDGKQLMSRDEDARLIVWDVQTATPITNRLVTSGVAQAASFTHDGSSVAYASTTADIDLWQYTAKEKICRGISLGYDSPYCAGAIAFSPDGSKMAINSTQYGVYDAIALLKTCEDDYSISASEVRLDYEMGFVKRLAYHPGGKHICLEDEVWDLAVEPPSSVTGMERNVIVKETFPFLRYNFYGSWPSISYSNDTFYIPKSLEITAHDICDGLIALGAIDGRVFILDFTHLATEEEKSLLNRVGDMRRRAACSSSKPIQDALARHAGRLTIPISTRWSW